MSSDSDNWQIFGPMDQVQLGKLTESLDLEGAEYKIEISEEEIEKHKDKSRNQPITTSSPFYSLANFYYIKIPTRNLLIVKKHLENIGFSLSSSNQAEIPSRPEFMCTRCKFMAHQPGFCPQHGVKLLEFSEWVAFKQAKYDRIQSRVLILLALILMFFVIRAHLGIDFP